jgi:hypothetical protein
VDWNNNALAATFLDKNVVLPLMRLSAQPCL